MDDEEIAIYAEEAGNHHNLNLSLWFHAWFRFGVVFYKISCRKCLAITIAEAPRSIVSWSLSVLIDMEPWQRESDRRGREGGECKVAVSVSPGNVKQNSSRRSAINSPQQITSIILPCSFPSQSPQFGQCCNSTWTRSFLLQNEM